MPRDDNLQSILIIGAGPIVIGQACEFDYSGTQACRALKEEGYRVILVNSNPATIMTDPSLADATYIEPVTPDIVSQIIAQEKPDALLPTVGGQTGLNCALELDSRGVLAEHHVALLAADAEVIRRAEDRDVFKRLMETEGIATANGGLVRSLEESETLVESLRFPLILRPSFTLGGTGGSLVYNREEYAEKSAYALAASPIGEVLIEEALMGWKEFELEVMRDGADNALVVCSIENIDPMGVHTGDSVTVAPAQTLSDREYQQMRDWALRCIRAVGVKTGGSNVQFAVNPDDGRMVIIEMNPRVSRSSALASKATGFPIAKVAAKLAVGYLLDEITNDITGQTLAAYEPALDYVVTKVPRFNFEKFPRADGILGVQMQSVGEVMAIGRTFQESIQKAYRSLEEGLDGLEPRSAEATRALDLDKMRFPTAFRLLKVQQALAQGRPVDEVHELTSIDPWFLHQINEIAQVNGQPLITAIGEEADDDQAAALTALKQQGFSDVQIGRFTGQSEEQIHALRLRLGVVPAFKSVDTCAAEFSANTPYCYSSYETENEVRPLEGDKVIILGSGPNRIGQGIEFDYCCVQALFALQEMGYKAIMHNCNPETVSTDFDMADRLYFEPLTFEDVMAVIDQEQPLGVMVQFGGQTPLALAGRLAAAGVNILGTSPEAIDLAEDREKFGALLDRLKIARPDYGIAHNLDEATRVAGEVGYPVLVRPSYVLGGRAMEIVYSQGDLESYLRKHTGRGWDHPILIDVFLEDAYEFDVDALCDGSEVFIAGIMQHIEEAGIHSGDSACVLPPYHLTDSEAAAIEQVTTQLALELGVKGLLNVQFAVKDDTVYVLEANPRASRTVPFVSKARNIPLAKWAAQIAAGQSLPEVVGSTLSGSEAMARQEVVAVKKPVFPFSKFPADGVYLSPEMKSTGEVMGIDPGLGGAYAKAEMGAGTVPPASGTVFISVNDRDKSQVVDIARDLHELGFSIIATAGTQAKFQQSGIAARSIYKVGEGRPDAADAIRNREVQLIINTPLGAQSRHDEYAIGTSALRHGVPFVTTLSGARAMVRAIRRVQTGQFQVRSLQNLFSHSD
ncbi:MAG: carbamoyl-phosphate synthase large subunit [Candidatus Marinimicrobia bacterium]|nr:carbamoyl-phosphate synthase large subunit [Candidatus Neomarinimicrobiota bacterium]